MSIRYFLRLILASAALVSPADLLAKPDADAEAASLRVEHLRCEYLVNPFGIDSRAPRLSWKLAAVDAKARGLSQSAYQIVVVRPVSTLRHEKDALWDSGKVPSDQSLH